MTPLQLRIRKMMAHYRDVLHNQGPDVALLGIEGEIMTLIEDARAEVRAEYAADPEPAPAV